MGSLIRSGVFLSSVVFGAECIVSRGSERERQTIGEGMWFMIGYSAARAVAAVQHDIDANAP